MIGAYYNLLLASAYGSGAYSSNNYNGTDAGSGVLGNTGLVITIVVTLAAVLLLTAMAIRIWRRPGKNDQSAATADPLADK